MLGKISRSPQLECCQGKKNVGRKSQVEGGLQAGRYSLGIVVSLAICMFTQVILFSDS